jgi:hypothetical protein
VDVNDVLAAARRAAPQSLVVGGVVPTAARGFRGGADAGLAGTSHAAFGLGAEVIQVVRREATRAGAVGITPPLRRPQSG